MKSTNNHVSPTKADLETESLFIQCCNIDERYFCPNCRMSWYSSVSRCAACGNSHTVMCTTTETEARSYGRPLTVDDLVKVV